MEITANVHLIPNVIANPYLIIDPDGLTLIDAGLPGNGKKIIDYIAGLGYSPSDLKRILITHSDIDHVGSLAFLKTASGAHCYASAIEAQAIAEGHPSRDIRIKNPALRLINAWLLRRAIKVAPLQPDEIVSEGQTLPVLGGLQVLETSGHTPGHISLFSSSTGILFSGDSIISRGGVLMGSVPTNTWDEKQAAESVRKQAALRSRMVCPGHGSVVMEAAGKFPTV